MKTVLLVFILLISFTELFSQNLVFRDTTKLNGTKDELYKKALICIAKNYNDANKVIQFKDQEMGCIVVKGVFEYNQKKFIWGGNERTKGFVSYSLTLNIVDNKIIAEIGDFVHKADTSFGALTIDENCPRNFGILNSKKWNNWIWGDLKESAKQNSIGIINMFHL